MSEKKTLLSGLEYNPVDDPYNRDFEANDKFEKNGGKGTILPGMNNERDNHEDGDDHDPIVGFLFSVSRTPMGEYWPLYLGKNTIGRDNETSMVYLPEGSVSGEHALLVVEQTVNPNETIAVLENKGSKNGTFINGKRVIYGRTEECKNGDILRFGGSYECMLILFDVREVGLKTADNFIPVEKPAMFGGSGDFPYRGDDQMMNDNKGTFGMDAMPSGGRQKLKTEV